VGRDTLLTLFYGREYHLSVKAGANIELKESEFRAAQKKEFPNK